MASSKNRGWRKPFTFGKKAVEFRMMNPGSLVSGEWEEDPRRAMAEGRNPNFLIHKQLDSTKIIGVFVPDDTGEILPLPS